MSSPYVDLCMGDGVFPDYAITGAGLDGSGMPVCGEPLNRGPVPASGECPTGYTREDKWCVKPKTCPAGTTAKMVRTPPVENPGRRILCIPGDTPTYTRPTPLPPAQRGARYDPVNGFGPDPQPCETGYSLPWSYSDPSVTCIGTDPTGAQTRTRTRTQTQTQTQTQAQAQTQTQAQTQAQSSSGLPFTEPCAADLLMPDYTTNTVKCPDPSQTTEAVCPSGYTFDGTSAAYPCVQRTGSMTMTTTKMCPNGYVNRGGVCQKLVTPNCPAGSVFYQVFTKGPDGNPVRPGRGYCIPNTVASYTRPIPQGGGPWPCDGSDPASVIQEGPGGTVKCFRVGGSASGATSGATGGATAPLGTFDELNLQYKQQVKEYEDAMLAALQANAPGRVPELRAKSEAIQATLAKMVESLTYLKKETSDVRVKRDTLLEDLRRIQRDYSAMLVNTDDLETLRRIRQQESGEARRTLNLYLLAFLFVAMALLVYIVFKGRNADTSSASAPTPTMSPALT